MRAIRFILAVSLLAMVPAAPAVARQLDGYVPREHHPWGQFKIGSWKVVRTEAETLNERGDVVSSTTTETTTKLVDVDDEGYTLRIDVVVEVAGKRFTAQPQVLRRLFHGEAEDKEVSVKRIGQEEIAINGQKVMCEVRQITAEGNGGKRITTAYYSERLAPYVLRRETTSLDAAGKPTEVQSQVDVIAVDMPYKVKAETKPTSQVRIMHQQGKLSTLTIEVHCADVPGSVVAHTSKETDDSGRVVRRSTLRLVEYEIGDGDDDEAQMVRKAFYRVRNRRTR